MKALTLRHPWPWAIVALGKRVENRTWPPFRLEVGEWFAIHGGKVPTGRDDLEEVLDEARALAEMHREMVPEGAAFRDALMPGVVAVCRLGGFVTESDDPWFEGPYGWVLEDVTPLPEPVPCKGAQGLWPLPEDVLAAVRAQYRQARPGPARSLPA